MKKRLVLGLVLILYFIHSEAQSTHYGIGFGQALYWGDLNGPSFGKNLTKNNGYAFQVFGRRHFNEFFAVNGSLIFSRVRGSDANSNLQWQKERNLSFRSVINELSINFEYYPLRFAPGTTFHNFSPFISFGLAGFYFNPTAIYQGNEYELQRLGTEGQGIPGFKDKYSKFSGALSFGGGLALKINEQLIIHGSLICKRTFTDYIDDVSGNYVNYNELLASNGALSAALADRTGEFLGGGEPIIRETGTQRGGASVRDYYFTALISFSIKLMDDNSYRKRKSKVKCPQF
jgi:hypothetical protein